MRLCRYLLWFRVSRFRLIDEIFEVVEPSVPVFYVCGEVKDISETVPDLSVGVEEPIGYGRQRAIYGLEARREGCLTCNLWFRTPSDLSQTYPEYFRTYRDLSGT